MSLYLALVTKMNAARAAKAAKKAAKKDKKRKLAAAEGSSSSSSSSSSSGGAAAENDKGLVVAGPEFDAKAAAKMASERGEATASNKKKKASVEDGNSSSRIGSGGAKGSIGLASSSASAMTSSILEEVAKVRDAQSDLYKGLFKGTGNRKMQKADDVFIRDTGQRYTLG